MTEAEGIQAVADVLNWHVNWMPEPTNLPGYCGGFCWLSGMGVDVVHYGEGRKLWVEANDHGVNIGSNVALTRAAMEACCRACGMPTPDERRIAELEAELAKLKGVFND